MAEQGTHKPLVVSSSLTLATIESLACRPISIPGRRFLINFWVLRKTLRWR